MSYKVTSSPFSLWGGCRKNKILLFLLAFIVLPAHAHHILGRPAYNLNEDSNTPPSMQVETQIGDYFVTYMVFPAFPKAGQRGRVNLYATRIDNGDAYNGEVTFEVKDDKVFGNKNIEVLGTQLPDDSVYRQGFVFSKNGDYIITATFRDGKEPYIIDFPLRIGPPDSIGPIGIAIAAIVLILVSVNLVQRKRLLRSKFRHSHDEKKTGKTT
ncbi:FIG00921845: hypothetical protein [hydrothermal vent metagenome]|uniref:YtkA-like domain-containing protein n=1 Tax=hydrothermal vent metagenome TaxID=652676 RepID=A0A3B0WHK2_9ZZZZ